MASKILIVEDERDIAEMLKLRLEEHGYDIALAHDGLTALELAQSYQPALMLLDYTLPKLKGDEVCRKIKNDEKTKSIRVVLLSAYREDQISDDKIADAFLGKPYDPEQLLKTIQSLLA